MVFATNLGCVNRLTERERERESGFWVFTFEKKDEGGMEEKGRNE